MKTSHEEHIIETYTKRAANYDITANLYYLFGYREWAYRELAVKSLRLEPGETVLDLACGTGLNFPLYQEYIGSKGKIIGVDLTKAMLEQAKKRAAKYDWENVNLVHADASTYLPPSPVNSIISTFALSLFTDPKHTLNNINDSLLPKGRIVLLELQIPTFWPSWLNKAAVSLMKPFAVRDDWVKRQPWKTIQQTMKQLFTNVEMTEHYFGLTYIISGEKAAM